MSEDNNNIILPNSNVAPSGFAPSGVLLSTAAPIVRTGRSMTKDTIAIRTYSIPEKPPEKLAFSNHLMRFEGLKPFDVNKDLIWGVQGTTALNRADVFASMDAKFKNRRVYQIELLYRLQGQPLAGTSVSEEFTKSSGYLHFSRLTSGFRKKVLEQMMDWLTDEKDPQIDMLAKFDLEMLTEQRPMLIHRLMFEQTHLNTVIHSVVLAGGATLRVATLRNLPENIVRVQTRFHENIETTV